MTEAEFLDQQIKAIRATVNSDGWRIIRAQLEEALAELDYNAQAERDTLMSAKKASEAYGVRKCILMIEQADKALSDGMHVEPPPEEFPDEGRFGDDTQEKTQ